MTRRSMQVALVLGALVLVVLALGQLPATAPAQWGTASLVVVLVALVVSVGGVWVRTVESVLTLVFVLLYLVPQNYVLVGPLRSAGNPAVILGMTALALWVAGRLLGLVTARRDHPARWTVLAFVLTACTAFAAGMMRPLTSIEATGAIRVLFPLAALVGIALLACDGLTQASQVDALIQRVVIIGAIAAAIGIIEFVVPTFSYRTLAHLPGLTTNTDLITDTRSGFRRVNGGAAHPIEYSIAEAALVPLALHLVYHAATRAARILNLVALGLLLAVVPMTVSRSGIVCLAIGIGWYMVHLNNRARLNLVALGLLGLGAMRGAVPGLLGTLSSLLVVGSADPSIRGRTSDYAKIPQLMDGHWFFGRGLGTFQPNQYFFLDNQYLGSLLEGGVVGLAAFIAVLVVGMSLARGARRRATSEVTRGLGQALSASIAALAAGAALFDELSFRQTGFLLFLLFGVSGALWTIVRRGAASDEPAGPDAQQVLDGPTPVHGHTVLETSNA